MAGSVFTNAQSRNAKKRCEENNQAGRTVNPYHILKTKSRPEIRKVLNMEHNTGNLADWINGADT